MMKSRVFPAAFALAWALAASAPAAEHRANSESPARRDARLAWWREARFGMFLHWGPVSLQGTEIGWSRAGERRGYPYRPGTEVPVEIYDNLYKKFNPTQYHPEDWVALAREAGMKYVVLTTRHHDGFSMFDTHASDYKITSPSSPYRRDIVAALAEACHREGVHFGIYYSQPDWHNPDAFTPDRHQKYKDYLKNQLTELLSNYGRVDYLFFDGLGPTTPENPYGGPALNALVRRLQPQIIINDRNGPPSDFGTPEQTIGGFQLDRPWETCMTLGTQWSWKPGDQIKSTAECIRILARCAGGDGNLLLNVGPMPNGQIEPRQVEVLRGIGKWLVRNGQSICGTRGGPFRPTEMIASTRKGTSIYLHLLNPEISSITLPPLPAKVVDCTNLEGQAPVGMRTEDGYCVLLPTRKADQADTVLEIKLDRPADTVPAVDLPAPSVGTKSKAGAAASESKRPKIAVYYFPNDHPGDPRNSRMKGEK